MFKIKKSIYSIMMLFAVGTAAAQTPALELTSYPKPQKLIDFGSEVAVHDRFTLVGAQFDNNNNGQNGGAGTYHGTLRLFEEGKYLTTYTFGNGQIVGIGRKGTMSIGFQCVAAGAPEYTIGGVKSGGVVIANKLNNGTYHTTLNYQLLPEPNDVVENLKFGAAVSTDGSWVAVGAPGRNNSTGGVCMFQRTGYLQWVRRGWIPVPGLQVGEQFGEEVKLSGDQMIVKGGNKLYFYKLINGIWTNVAQIVHPLRDGSYFEIGITENYAVARSFNSDFQVAADVFRKGVNNSWSLSQTITGPGEFAREIAISGQWLIISNFNKVFYYQLQGSVYNIIGSIYIPANNPSTGRLNKKIIGNAIDIHGDRIVVADLIADYVNYPNLGAVYTDRAYNGWGNSNHFRVENAEMGTSEMLTSTGFSVYPNPSASKVTVTSSGEILKATATSSTGDVVRLEFAGKTLMTDQLSAGLYQINVETSEGSFATKFVKQ